MKKSLLTVLAVLTAAAPALAQVPVFSQSSQTYVPLSGGTNVFTSYVDDGSLLVPLQFSFPYFGQNYNSVLIQSNGFISFDTTVCTSGCFSSSAIPGTSTPNNMIAAWWDDLVYDPATVGSQVRYVSTASDFTVEYAGYEDLSNTYVINMQIKITAGGTIFVHYGPKTGTGGSASAGFESAGGTQGASFMSTSGNTCTPSSQAGCCSATTANCNLNDWVPNSIITIGEPAQADLGLSAVTISNLTVLGNNNLTFNVNGTIKNYGRTPAPNFNWRAFLSTDRILDLLPDGGGDPQVAGGGPVSMGASDAGVPASLSVSGPAATTTPPPPGQYYVLVQADSTNTVTEAVETNNVGSTATYFVYGLDLVATSISGPANTGGGNTENIQVNWFNQGTNPAGTVTYRILMSADTAYDVNDFVVHTGTRSVSGGETVNEAVSVTIPAAAPNGDFYWLLQIDPANAVTEASETNNVAASSAKVSVRRADLVNEGIQWLDPVTNLATTTGRFGEAARASVRLSNQGGANAQNFYVAVVISTDATLSLLSDTLVWEQTVASVPAGAAAQTITLDFPLPLQNQASQPFPTGNYFAFVVIDSRGSIYESNKANNNLNIGPLRITAPGPDLLPSTVQGPASAGVGETIPVFRTFRNVGNRDAAAAQYRFYASANNIITADDIPLSIVGSGGTTADFGTVTLARATADSATELLRLPGTMPAGTYYVGAIIDTLSAVTELDEANNAMASSTVQIAPSSLRVSTTQLPDATVGRPYSFRLTALGEQGASTWSTTDVLPEGLTLAADGLLSGSPTGNGALVTGFTVLVSNANRTASARLVVRVLPPSSQVEITTTSIPAIVNSPSSSFVFSLGAAGGVKPYTWAVVSGALPNGIALAADGALSGAPRAGTPDGLSRVVFEVRDATGTRAQRELLMRLVAAGSIVFRTNSLPDAVMGVDYAQDIAVQNLDMSPLAKPLTWKLVGQLPDGITMTEETEVVNLSGRPIRAGAFGFSLTVEDARGRSDSMDFTIVVYPPRYKVSATGLPDVLRPGEAGVAVQFSVSPSVPVTYRVVAGAVPPGLALSADGQLSGTVAEEGSVGTWNFVVEAKDDVGASGLAPFALRVELAKKKEGCSAAAGLSPLTLAALGLLGLRRRARRPSLRAAASQRAFGLAPLLAVLALAVPSAALAQYQVVGPTPISFSTLVSRTTVTQTFSGVNIALPFNFTFYGQSYASVNMSRYGYLVFSGGDGSDSVNQPVPHNTSFYPTTFAAPWWDSLSSTSSVGTFGYAVLGTAPQRVMVIEWRDVAYTSSTTARFSFQVLLYETTNQIRFAYGPTAPGTASASVGIQGQLNVGVPGTTCGGAGTCSPTDWPANQAIDFFLPPDLRIGSVSVDQTGYAGVQYRASATVRNLGGRAASNVTVRFVLSTDTALDTNDVLIGDAVAPTVLPFDEVLVTSTASIPAGTAPGNYYVIPVVDPDNLITELIEANNNGTPLSMTVGQPTADLVVSGFTGPGTAAPGAMVQVTRSISNTGNAAAGSFKYTYFLSDNPVVSISDTALSPVGTVSGLPAAGIDTQNETIALPAGLPAGQYWLGVCVNYDAGTSSFGAAEISLVNNCYSSASPLVLSTGTVTILTTTLPSATQYAPYGVRLLASGGTGSYAWSLMAGALPPGLSLTPAGDLLGAPATTGTFSFDVQVQSGTVSNTQSLSLQVVQGNLPLVVVDQDLPAAEFGRSYAATIVAVGGKPPYRWALKGGTALPSGLALSTDGTIEGRASESGEKPFSVEVTDSAGATASKDLKIRVVNPTALSIATRALQTGYIKREFLQSLVAVGGRGPYAWGVVRFQQLPENPTEQPGAVLGTLPDDFGLVVEDGVQNDYLRGVPKKAGLYSLTLKVVDSAGTEDLATVALYVTYTEGFAMITTVLPDAFVNQNYAVKLSHNGGRDAEGVQFTLPCVKQAIRADEFVCAATDPGQTLPPGLTLGSDGSIIGLPLGPEGTYTFLVKVTDAFGRQDVRGLSIRVRPDYTITERGGCAGTDLEPSLLAALALASLALRRRRG